MEGLLASGDWSEARNLRRPKSNKPVKDAQGQLADSDDRADRLAEDLGTVQWAVRPVACAPPRLPLDEPLQLRDELVSQEDVAKAARRLKWNKSFGPDKIPGEYWKAILLPNSPSIVWMTELCQA